MEQNDVPVILTAVQLAEILQVKKQTIWAMATRRQIPVIRIGRNLRFDRQAVLVALERTEKR